MKAQTFRFTDRSADVVKLTAEAIVVCAEIILDDPKSAINVGHAAQRIHKFVDTILLNVDFLGEIEAQYENDPEYIASSNGVYELMGGLLTDRFQERLDAWKFGEGRLGIEGVGGE